MVGATAKETAVHGTDPPGGGGGTATEPAGPTTDFEALYTGEWAGLVALGWSLTGNWTVAEDLVQEAFAAAHGDWARVGRLDRPGAWVRRAVINRAANVRRDRASEERGLARWSARSSTDADGVGADRTADGATDRVGDPAFWAAVRALPERQAACVALHYLEDRSVAEIAEVLGCGVATVKVHLHRGRQNLARRLAALAPGRASGATGSTAREGAEGADDRRTIHGREEEGR